MADHGANGHAPLFSSLAEGLPRASDYTTWLSQQPAAATAPAFSGQDSEAEQGEGGGTSAAATRRLGRGRYSRG
jgi:hypothetical protein